MSRMSLAEIWKAYRECGLAAIEARPVEGLPECFYLSALAFREGRFDLAGSWAERALEQRPDSLVAFESEKYLRHVARSGKHEVYATGRGFARFIHGGGNLELYESLSDSLRRIYLRQGKISMLEVGAGDGRALLPALSANVVRLDVVEPSAKMLADLGWALDELGVEYRAFNQTLQEFTKESRQRWDVVQATYSLHTVPPVERRAMLGWVREHGDLLLMAEFDVPDLGEPCSPESVRYLLERYEGGLAEYEGHERDVVAQEFLIPVLFGNFDRDQDRMTFEQPIDGWQADLESVGFVAVRRHLISRYWWADSYLVEAAADLRQAKDKPRAGHGRNRIPQPKIHGSRRA